LAANGAAVEVTNGMRHEYAHMIKWLSWVVAFIAIASWVGSYLIYFNKDFQRWRRERPRRRAEAAAAAKRKAEEHARLLDDLASKYPLPSAPPPPRR
jgi:hypothetical protein